jgi:uncharacterized membrane protein YdjX (TVP38/TMEM64 family)
MSPRAVQRGLSFAAIAIGVAGFVWLHFHSGIEWSAESLRDWARGLGAFGPLVLIAIMALRPFLGLPNWLVLIACGMLFGPWLGMVCGAIGGWLGGLLIFGIARALGREAVQSRLGGGLRIFEELLARRGAPWVCLYAAVPVSPLLPLFASAGVSRMPLAGFAVAVFVGLWPRAALYTFGSQAFAEPTPLNIGAAALLVAAGVGVTLFARRSFRRS